MIYALIKNQVVQNVISADEQFVESLKQSEDIDDYVLIEENHPRPNPGDSYIDGVFSPQENLPVVLNAAYQCLECRLFTESKEEVRAHVTDNAGHIFARVFS